MADEQCDDRPDPRRQDDDDRRPFAETKESLGGYYQIEAKDLDEALELAAACPGAKWGSVEVRPVVDFAAGQVPG